MRIAGALLLAALLAGCQRELLPPAVGSKSAPPMVKAPILATAPTDPPLPQQTMQLAPPAPAARRPLQRDPAAHPGTAPRPSASPRSTRPPRLAQSAPPPRPQQAQTPPPARPAPARPQASKPPSFDLPEPDYPTAAPRSASGGAPAQYPQAPQQLAANNGLGRDPHGELFLLDEEEARPTYHPAVVIEEWRDEQWLTVQFDIAPNGRFRVSLLEGTGDPALDAIALKTLREWRWQPKTIKRRPVASTEVLRLKRNVTKR